VTIDSGALQRAEVLLGVNRPREAGELAARAAAARPSDPQPWIVLARCYEMTNEPRRSLEMANRAIGLDPSDPDPHLIASGALRKLRTFELAVHAAQEAVRLAPMSAAAHANLAIALAGLGRGQSFFGHFLPRSLRLAHHHAREAMALSPTSTVGIFAVGFVAGASNQPRAARAHYRRVLAIDPQNASALNNLALLDLGSGRVTRSGKGFARALAADPTLGLARRNVGATVRGTAFLFHCLGWLLYCCFSGIAANQQVGKFTVVWSTRAKVAVWLGCIFAAMVLVTYRRMEPSVRAFARRMIADSWAIKAALVADAVTFGCFVVSTFGRGPLAADIYLIGLLGIGAGYAGFVVSRPAALH
jgi:tetratricopeptide (TPR) repeat protein